jgi:hypothetical protein
VMTTVTPASGGRIRSLWPVGPAAATGQRSGGA